MSEVPLYAGLESSRHGDRRGAKQRRRDLKVSKSDRLNGRGCASAQSSESEEEQKSVVARSEMDCRRELKRKWDVEVR